MPRPDDKSAQDSPAVGRWEPPDPANYAYLLGMYLGDGNLTHHRSTYGLQITLDSAHPEIVAETERAMYEILGTRVSRYYRPGSAAVRLTSYSRRLPEMFPQHGPGKKHERKIELVEWQRAIVDAHPRQFIRGLIHSDGCRCENRFTVQLKAGPREYAYPRYFFSNLSADIRGLFCEHCDRLELRWSLSNHRNVSVSHRRSVAILDEFVGPKR